MKNLHIEPYEFYRNLKPQERTAVVCGNGPSLRDFDFARELEGFDVFGMNAAYRHWDKVGWYPDYYICRDPEVGMSHVAEISRLVERRMHYGIRAFALTANVVRALGVLGKLSCVVNLDFWAVRMHKIFFDYASIRYPISTGISCLLWAAYLGYKNIILLGVDGYPVEALPETVIDERNICTITETPKSNPNYFIDDYQRKGDIYNNPNTLRYEGFSSLRDCWQGIAAPLRLLDVVVVHANPASTETNFTKCSFEQAVPLLVGLRESLDASRAEPGLAGVHAREAGAFFNEVAVFYPYLPEKNGLMIDVGALNGSSSIHFLTRGYRVHAFEPDPENRAMLQRTVSGRYDMTIDGRAVTDISGEEKPWFRSPESAGASGLAPFTATHALTTSVKTITLRDYCAEKKITQVDFLKIDAEGFDLHVLKGFPFESLRPTCILCEFEDKKTLPLGYSVHDTADFLTERGYYVLMSEWHPIARYGIRHQWRRIVPWPSECLPFAWGNLLAFARKPQEAQISDNILKLIEIIGVEEGMAVKVAAVRNKLRKN